MTKVVINKCYGGFGLSEAAIHEYAKRKGMTLYPKHDRFGLTTHWTVPAEERPKELEDWHAAPLEDRKAYNDAYSKAVLYDRDIPRDDADLVAVVEGFDGDPSGKHARLAVVEIPDDVAWEIEEYDGTEWIAETHRSWT